MIDITFVVGIERFNAGAWNEVERQLAAEGVAVRLRRFNDAHVDRDDAALAEAIASSEVVFMSLINLRSQADWLAARLADSKATAVFAYESMPEVMALTRVLEHRFKERKSEAPKIIKVLMRLMTRGRDEDALYTYTKLVKVAAKMLPLIPKKMAGFRAWLGVNLYWNQPDASNITQMVKLILRDVCGQALEVAPVAVIPIMGCFDARSGSLFATPDEYLKWASRHGHYKKGQPLIAVLGMRKHVVQRLGYLAELLQALEARGVRVWPVEENASGRVDVSKALRLLASRGIVTLLVEGGSEVAGSFLAGELADELHAFLAPKLLGPRGRAGAVDWCGPAEPSEAPQLVNPTWELCGRDAYVHGRIAHGHPETIPPTRA